jgi:hypothetical protein
MAATGEYSGQQLTRFAQHRGLRSRPGLVLNRDTVCDTILRNRAYYGIRHVPLGRQDLRRKLRAPHHRGSLRPRPTRPRATIARQDTTAHSRTPDSLRAGPATASSPATSRSNGTCTTGAPAPKDASTTTRNARSKPTPSRSSSPCASTRKPAPGSSTNSTPKTRPQNEEHAARLKKRLTELDRLAASAYEEKLLGTIDQDFWQERTIAWQHERDELRAELSRNEQVIPHEEFLAAARHPIELLQRAPDLYVTQEPSEKTGLLKTLVSNYTVTDGSLTVTLRSPSTSSPRGGGLVELNGIEPTIPSRNALVFGPGLMNSVTYR